MFEANAKYIAAANPAAVLELVAAIQHLQEHKDHLVELRQANGFDSWAAALVEVDKLKAENERLQRFETAYKEFSDKTDWVRPNAAAHELGMHVADVIRKRCDDLTSHNQAQADEIVRLRKNQERYDWLRDRLPGSAYRIAGVIYSEGGEGVDIAIDAAMAQEGQS